MRNRMPLLLSAAALVAAVLASTPVAGAVRDLVLPANSVGTAQIKANAVISGKIHDGAVAARDIQKNAITSGHVKDGSLRSADFRAGQLPAGPKGDKGEAGATNVVYRRAEVRLDTGGLKDAAAACAAGEALVGGGAAVLRAGDTLSADANVDLVASYPATTGITPPSDGVAGSRWVGVARVAEPSSSRLVVFASCARP